MSASRATVRRGELTPPAAAPPLGPVPKAAATAALIAVDHSFIADRERACICSCSLGERNSR